MKKRLAEMSAAPVVAPVVDEEPPPLVPNNCPECGNAPRITSRITCIVECVTLACKPSSGFRPFCTGLLRDDTIVQWNDWTKDGKWNPPKEWFEDWDWKGDTSATQHPSSVDAPTKV